MVSSLFGRKASILAEENLNFLKETVSSIPDIQPQEEEQSDTGTIPTAPAAPVTATTTTTIIPKVQRKPIKGYIRGTTNTRGRGRPKKFPEKEEISNQNEEDNDEIETLDDDEEDEDNSCDNSTCATTSKKTHQENTATVIKSLSSFSLPHKQSYEDDDYDS